MKLYFYSTAQKTWILRKAQEYGKVPRDTERAWDYLFIYPVAKWSTETVPFKGMKEKGFKLNNCSEVKKYIRNDKSLKNKERMKKFLSMALYKLRDGYFLLPDKYIK